jgi:cytoplasmic iron level regulating protein YaaA (DUF328/UPF0246 family)
MAAVTASSGEPCLVNLASEEYFKAVRGKELSCPMIQPVFEDEKNGKFKVVSFYAKRARGLMTRYALETRAETPEILKSFDREGYTYTPAASTATVWVFRRG